MGTKFRGRVPGLERDATFRLLLASGNFALCENEDGPLRIPFKDFVAACEAGELVVGRDGRVFVRPDDNAKSFGGGVVAASGFDQWWDRANF